MDGNLGPIPLPWEHIFFGLPCLQQILSCLLLHPTSWDRKEHFGEVSCGLAGKNIRCSCCRAGLRNMFPFGRGSTCDGCRTAWVLTIHAAAECVQRAGCRKDGSVNIILGQRAGWRGDALVHTISALGKDGFLVGVYIYVIFLFPEESFATRRELCDDIDRFYDGTATAESHECHSPRMSPVSL